MLNTNRFFAWVASLSLFLLLSSLISKGILSVVSVRESGTWYYRSRLTVVAAISFASLTSSLVMLHGPRMLPLVRKLIPRTRMAKIGVAAATALLICGIALVLWAHYSTPDLVREFESQQH